MVQRVCSLFLAGEWMGVEELLGQDPVVALGLAVVPWRVGARALVACHEIADCVVEGGGAVADLLSVTMRVMRPIPLASK